MSTVKSEWGMCCPKCGSDETLDVTAMISVRLTPDGTDAEAAQGDGHEWDDASAVTCVNCGWSGTVADTKPLEVAELMAKIEEFLDERLSYPESFQMLEMRGKAHGQLP